MAPRKSSLASFEQYHIPEPNSGCWLWTGALNNRGYGLLQCGGFKGYAHRFSYANFKGEIPEKMEVCHRCDTPCCVNPDHLFIGTRTENMQDCLRKGRHASENPRTNYARGSKAGQSKLVAQQVLEIRSLHGTANRAFLAQRYGVSKSAIKQIQLRKVWQHI